MKANCIFFCGDVHGNFPFVIQAVLTHRPAAVIFLGDLQAQRPLEQELEPILGLTEVWFIHGNHDTESQADHDNLFLSALADRNLHGRVVEIAGTRIAGLGGWFLDEVWMPSIGDAKYDSLADMEFKNRNVPILRAEKAILSRIHRSTLFPSDFKALAGLQADILVTHVPPSCHPYGFRVIDDLARGLQVGKVYHGHMHDRLDFSDHHERMGFKSYGVGFCGITDQDGNVICEGDFDEQNEQRYQQYRRQGKAQ